MSAFFTTRHPYTIYWQHASYLLVHYDELVTLRGDASTLVAQATLFDHDWLADSRLEPAALPLAGETTGVCKRCSYRQCHEKDGLVHRKHECQMGRGGHGGEASLRVVH